MFSFCDSAGSRTQDPQIKGLLLYQLSYEVIFFLFFHDVKERFLITLQIYKLIFYIPNKSIFFLFFLWGRMESNHYLRIFSPPH